MSDPESLVRLHLLRLLSQQLPEHEADALMLLATNDPRIFMVEVLAAEKVGRVRLPRHMVRMLKVQLLAGEPQPIGECAGSVST